MSCFSCFSASNIIKIDVDDQDSPYSDAPPEGKSIYDATDDDYSVTGKGGIAKTTEARCFTFRELATATMNFREDKCIGEGGFGKVVAVKRLNLDGLQGHDEFVVEVQMLSVFHHDNLVKLIGYCTQGDQRILVYEYMPKRSLEAHLFGDVNLDEEPLTWNVRMKIAFGAARGLEYLHCKANPPVIYRDLKAANILLDNDFNPKLSDFGLAKMGPVGDNTHVSTRVMGTYGYCAPEYAMSGKLTLMSDIYCFGVVLLELITGRKALDLSKPTREQNLVAWARHFMNDEKKYSKLADPRLHGNFHVRSFKYAVALAGMCLKEEAHSRPRIRDIVMALEYLSAKSSDHDLKQMGGNNARTTPTASQEKRLDSSNSLRSSKST